MLISAVAVFPSCRIELGRGHSGQPGWNAIEFEAVPPVDHDTATKQRRKFRGGPSCESIANVNALVAAFIFVTRLWSHIVVDGRYMQGCRTHGSSHTPSDNSDAIFDRQIICRNTVENQLLLILI